MDPGEYLAPLSANTARRPLRSASEDVLAPSSPRATGRRAHRNSSVHIGANNQRDAALPYAHLEEQGLEEIPETYLDRVFYRKIFASKNKLKVISPRIGELFNIAEIDISSNALTALPQEIGALLKLEVLRLGCNRFTTEGIPDTLRACSLLRTFSAEHNALEAVPLPVLSCVHISILNLSDNRIVDVSSLPSLVQLTELDLSENLITTLPSCVSDLVNLRVLKLDRNYGLAALPETLHTMPALTHLSACWCDLAELHPNLWRAPVLQTLQVSHNRIQTWPVLDGCLEISIPLATLDVSWNVLRDVPAGLRLMDASLTHLNLSFNRLRHVPYVPALRTLQVLRISGNEVSSLPGGGTSLGDYFPALEALHAGMNRIERFPWALRSSTLKILDVSRNRMTAVDKSVHLPALTEIRLAFNTFAELPEWVLQSPLPCLRVVDVMGNQLTSATVGGGVVFVDLRDNPLTSFPVLPSEEKDVPVLVVQPPQDGVYTPTGPLPAMLPQSLRSKALTPSYSDGNLSTATATSGRRRRRGGAIKSAADALAPATARPRHDVRLPSELTVAVDASVAASSPSQSAWLCEARCSPSTLPLHAGIASMLGRRPSMEDAALLSPFKNDSLLAAVFDGHAARDAAVLLAELLLSTLSSVCAEMPLSWDTEEDLANWTTAFVTCFDDLQAVLEATLCVPAKGLSQPILRSMAGATAAVAILDKDGGVVANTGDTRAVLAQYTDTTCSVRRLTVDHTPFHRKEFERITALGGYITTNGRVQGTLGVARALGDAYLQPFVSNTPDVNVWTCLPDTSSAIIIACDGVWDVLSDESAAQVVVGALQGGSSAEEAASLLRDAAFQSGSMDNISVVVAVP